MQKKIISLFIVLILGLFIAGCSGPVGQRVYTAAPEEPPTPATINANSCNADTVCELPMYITNTAGSIKFMFDEITLGVAGSNQGIKLTRSEQGEEATLTISVVGGSGEGTMKLAEMDLTVEKNLEVEGLTGEGNAYVCVNAYGQFFRSITPCV